MNAGSLDGSSQELFVPLGISLALGLLIGLQRQYSASAVAGLRTFPLVAVLGTIAAFADRALDAGGWIVAAAFLALAAVATVAKAAEARQDPPDLGLTTVAALLLTLALGVYVAFGDAVVAVAVGGGAAVLLQFKPELHGLVARLGAEDLRAIMTFVLITCIVLPLVPNHTYGPLEVLNPFHIWLMVVLIVGIGLAGYIVYKFFGETAGILLGGFLGGAISSTATTASYARRTAAAPAGASTAAAVIIIASTVVYLRVLAEIAVVAPAHLWQLSPPVAVVLLACVLASLVKWLRVRRSPSEMPKQANPAELRSALVFALLYALVLLALAAAKEYLGGSGLYAVAALSGLTDMDAITISTARLVESQDPATGLAPETGWRLILLASASNLVFKAGIVAVAGGRALLFGVLRLFLLPLVAAGLVIWLWP